MTITGTSLPQVVEFRSPRIASFWFLKLVYSLPRRKIVFRPVWRGYLFGRFINNCCLEPVALTTCTANGENYYWTNDWLLGRLL
jgi:hypothetical protein